MPKAEEANSIEIYVTIKKYEDGTPYAVLDSEVHSVGTAGATVTWILKESEILPNAKLLNVTEESGGNIQDRAPQAQPAKTIRRRTQVDVQADIGGVQRGEMTYNIRYLRDSVAAPNSYCEVLAVEPNVRPSCVNHKNKAEDGTEPIFAPSPPPRLRVP